MESFIHSFGIEWKLLIAQIINFGILVLVLARFVYRPLLNVIDERIQKVKEAEEKSSSADARLEEIKNLENEVLAKARVAGAKIVEDAEKAAKENAARILAQAQTEADKIASQGKLALEQESVKIREAFKSEALSIVALALEKTVGKYLDSDAKQKISTETNHEVSKLTASK